MHQKMCFLQFFHLHSNLNINIVIIKKLSNHYLSNNNFQCHNATLLHCNNSNSFMITLLLMRFLIKSFDVIPKLCINNYLRLLNHWIIFFLFGCTKNPEVSLVFALRNSKKTHLSSAF